jgi:hypothetical protein
MYNYSIKIYISVICRKCFLGSIQNIVETCRAMLVAVKIISDRPMLLWLLAVEAILRATPEPCHTGPQFI